MNGACADKPRKSVGVHDVCNCTFNPPHDAPRKLSLNVRKEKEVAGSQGQNRQHGPSKDEILCGPTCKAGGVAHSTGRLLGGGFL